MPVDPMLSDVGVMLGGTVEEEAVFARIAGPAEALDGLTSEIVARWPGAAMTAGDAAYLWQSIVGLRWAHSTGTVAKVALTPAATPEFINFARAQSGARAW